MTLYPEGTRVVIVSGDYMMTDRKTIENLKTRYLEGIRVVLVQMDDVQAPPVGTKGTVTGVDDIGSIHVQWDNGSTLAVIYGEDMCRVIDR